MPICQRCAAEQHQQCDDTQHARLYRSCYCQHKMSPAPSDSEGGSEVHAAMQCDTGGGRRDQGGIDAGGVITSATGSHGAKTEEGYA